MKSQKYYSLWLCLIIIIIFIFQNLPGIPGFTETFVLNQKALTNLQFHRYLTAIFLHGSITHLAFNLFALFFFGLTLEKTIGSRIFLLTFLSTGIIANIISVNFYNSSLGASGAIYGIIGTATILRPMMMVYSFGAILPMFLAAILYIGADILRTMGAFGPTNVGSIAHLSGMALGLLIGIYLRTKFKQSKQQKTYFHFNEPSMRNWEDRFMKS
jgi:membrane associated rhomboid family serine protease